MIHKNCLYYQASQAWQAGQADHHVDASLSKPVTPISNNESSEMTNAPFSSIKFAGVSLSVGQ